MGRINDDVGVFLLIFAATNLTLLTFQSISLVISAVRGVHFDPKCRDYMFMADEQRH